MKAAGGRRCPSEAELRRRAHRVARRLVFTFARAATAQAMAPVDLPLDLDPPEAVPRVDILLELSPPVPRGAHGRTGAAAFERGAPRAGMPRGRRGRGRGRGAKAPGNIDEALN
jgi:hypothetical protein